MKKIYIIILLAFGVMLSFFSCEEDEKLKLDSNQFVKPKLETNHDKKHFTLTKEAKDKIMAEFKWSAASFGYDAAITYEIEIGEPNGSFKDSKVLFKTDTNAISITQEEFNNWGKKNDLKPNSTYDFEMRVRALVHKDVDILYSNKISFVVTTYLDVVQSPQIYLVGGATVIGWSDKQAIPLYKNEQFSEIYAYLKKGEAWRFLGQQGWSPDNYGFDFFSKVPSEIVKDQGPNDHNFEMLGATGIYKVMADFDKKDLSMKLTTLPVDVANLYLVGTINGWNAEAALEMTKNGDVFTYEVALDDGATFKFIGQKSWGDLEWGNIKSAGEVYSGVLGPKGDNGNIKFDGGGKTYVITANVKGGYYSVVEKK